MGNTAYTLRDEYAGTVDVDGETVDRFTGGVIATGAGDLNLKDELEAGGGTIVVADDADPRIATALDEHPALKRVAAGDADATVGAPRDYNARTRDDLAADASARNIAGASSARKSDLVYALTAHDDALAAGTLAELGDLTVDNLANPEG